jgi:hypothetical protein
VGSGTLSLQFAASKSVESCKDMSFGNTRAHRDLTQCKLPRGLRTAGAGSKNWDHEAEIEATVDMLLNGVRRDEVRSPVMR